MRAPVAAGVLAFAALAACKQTEENQAPIATASGPETVDAGTWVQLDGSESSDPEGADLHRRWSFVALPLASEAVLNDPTVENPSFLADVPGEYVVRLVVDDGFLRSAPASVTVTAEPVNHGPSADAGLDRGVVTGNEVLLDGSESFDPDGDDLTYDWSFVEKPSGSIAAFDDSASATPTFTADLDGDYRVHLVVSDGEASSAPDEVVVNASADNLAPVAEAGVDQSVAVGTTVQLDGSSSYDPNGADLTYAWTFTGRPDGSTATLTQDGTAAASFVADVEGSYVVALVVDDGLVTSAPDTLHVQAFIENTPPVADAGDDAAGAVGDPIQLDGSGSSDADGDLLAFDWQFTSLPPGSEVVLNNPNVVSPTFVPDVETDLDGTPDTPDDFYELRLQVWDGVFWSTADTVRVTAGVGNIPPVADAQPESLATSTGSTVQLDGSGSSDADGDSLTYEWRFTSTPEGFFGGLNDTTIVNPSFVATVDASSEDPYVLELRVWDGTAWSTPDTATITSTGGNVPPTAVIEGGTNCTLDSSTPPTCAVDAGTVVTLDGRGSSDPNGDSLQYEWAFTAKPAGSTAAFNDPTLANPSFVPDVDDEYLIRLRVYDGQAWSDPVSVAVDASGANQPPIADAGADRTVDDTSTDALPDACDARNTTDDSVQTGDPVQLDGTGSTDPEGDPLTYQWAFQSIATGSQAALNNTAVSSPSFTPDVNGVYVASLVVSDGALQDGPDFVCIEATGGNTAPVVCAYDDDDDPTNGCVASSTTSPAEIVAPDATVHLDDGSAFDAEGDPLTYEWQFTQLPAGSDAVLNDPNVANPSFLADEVGFYGLRVRASDGDLDSTWSYVVIEAQ